MSDDIFEGFGIRVNIDGENGFRKIMETLKRIGIPRYKDNTLFQSCHILQKRGEYAIMHFKELFAFDGKANNLTEDDIARRNLIVRLLLDWELISLDGDYDLEPTLPANSVKILRFSEKNDWNLEQKYNIGNKRQ